MIDVDNKWSVGLTTTTSGIVNYRVLSYLSTDPLPLDASFRVEWFGRTSAPFTTAVAGTLTAAAFEIKEYYYLMGSDWLYSPNLFQTNFKLTFNPLSSLAPSSDVCTGTASPAFTVYDIIPLTNSHIYTSSWGVFKVNQTGWTRLASVCARAQSFRINSYYTWSPIVFKGSGSFNGKLYYLSSEYGSWTECLDTQGRTVSTALFASASITLLDVTGLVVQPNSTFALVQVTSNYHLVKWSAVNNSQLDCWMDKTVFFSRQCSFRCSCLY